MVTRTAQLISLALSAAAVIVLLVFTHTRHFAFLWLGLLLAAPAFISARILRHHTSQLRAAQRHQRPSDAQR